MLCRDPNRTSTDVSSLVLLENVHVSKALDETTPFSFRLSRMPFYSYTAHRLGFFAGDHPLLFAARTESEANIWMDHLRTAPLSENLLRIRELREQITIETGTDPLNAVKTQISWRTSIADESRFISLSGSEIISALY